MWQIFLFLWQNLVIFVAKFGDICGKIWGFKWQFSTMPDLILNTLSKVKSHRDSNDNLLVNSPKVWQVTKQNKMLHMVDLLNNVAQSNTIQYFRHVITYYYISLLYLSHKRMTWTSGCRNCLGCCTTAFVRKGYFFDPRSQLFSVLLY